MWKCSIDVRCLCWAMILLAAAFHTPPADAQQHQPLPMRLHEASQSAAITVVQQNGAAMFRLPLELVPKISGEVVRSVTISEENRDIVTNHAVSPFRLEADGSTKVDILLQFYGLPGDTHLVVVVTTSENSTYVIRPTFAVVGIAVYQDLRDDNGKLRMFSGPDAEILNVPLNGQVREVSARTFAGISGKSRAAIWFDSDIGTIPWDYNECDSLVDLNLEKDSSCSLSFASLDTNLFQIRSLAKVAPPKGTNSKIHVVWSGLAFPLREAGIDRGNQLRDPRVTVTVQEFNYGGANRSVTSAGIWCTLAAIALLFWSISCCCLACNPRESASGSIASGDYPTGEGTNSRMPEPDRGPIVSDCVADDNSGEWNHVNDNEQHVQQLSSNITYFPEAFLKQSDHMSPGEAVAGRQVYNTATVDKIRDEFADIHDQTRASRVPTNIPQETEDVAAGDRSVSQFGTRLRLESRRNSIKITEQYSEVFPIPTDEFETSIHANEGPSNLTLPPDRQSGSMHLSSVAAPSRPTSRSPFPSDLGSSFQLNTYPGGKHDHSQRMSQTHTVTDSHSPLLWKAVLTGSESSRSSSTRDSCGASGSHTLSPGTPPLVAPDFPALPSFLHFVNVGSHNNPACPSLTGSGHESDARDAGGYNIRTLPDWPEHPEKTERRGSIEYTYMRDRTGRGWVVPEDKEQVDREQADWDQGDGDQTNDRTLREVVRRTSFPTYASRARSQARVLHRADTQLPFDLDSTAQTGPPSLPELVPVLTPAGQTLGQNRNELSSRPCVEPSGMTRRTSGDIRRARISATSPHGTNSSQMRQNIISANFSLATSKQDLPLNPEGNVVEKDEHET